MRKSKLSLIEIVSWVVSLKIRVDDARFVTSIENTTVSGSSWQGLGRQLVFGSLLRQFPYIQIERSSSHEDSFAEVGHISPIAE